MYGDFLYDIAVLTFWSAWYPALDAIDIRTAAMIRFEAAGADLTNFDERLACYEVHIGLTSIAYQAYTGRFEELDWTAARVASVIAALD